MRTHSRSIAADKQVLEPRSRVALTTWMLLCGAVLAYALAAPARAERVKDLASVAGVRDNQLVGYGLVVGLNGTGDSSSQVPFTSQSLKSMLNRMGIALPSNTNPSVKNVAAVAIHAVLPPFAKPGQTIDVTASTIGDAKSIRGGTLLMSPLQGADGSVYAIAQGNVVVGGFGASSEGNSVTVNVPTVGRVPNGATVERPAPTPFANDDFLFLNLHRPDFTTAQRVAEAINTAIGEGAARPSDAGTVRVAAPRDAGQRVGFLALVENVSLTPGEAAARVIINARSGTVVIGQNVRVSPAAVAHGNLSVTISNTTDVSQPAPLAGGTTVAVPNADIEISEERKSAFVFDPGVSLDEIVRAINRVGASPSDLVAILEALREAGALRAELQVI